MPSEAVLQGCCAALSAFLDRMPLGKVVVRRAVSGAATHDAETWFYDRFIGVVKVYALQDDSGMAWVLPVSDLTALREALYSGRRWTKRVALVGAMEDGRVFMMDMLTLAPRFRDLEKTQDGLGVLIPLEMTIQLA